MDGALYQERDAAHVKPLSKSPGDLTSPSPLVLVVDDDSVGREMLADILAHQGYRVFEAANGRQAIDQLTTRAAAARLIVLDLDMPVMNGWEFLDHHRSRSDSLATKIVVITGHDQVPIAGTSAVLKKPLEIARFLELVRQLLKS
jgi:chemotaxis family two-component system sensor histidine kinase/response regulator PixL